MLRALAGRGAGRESDYAFEFEQAPYLTLGAAYEERRSLSGGAYHPLLRRIEDFLDESLAKAVRERERRAAKLLKLDEAVSNVVAALKERGLTSPYLEPFPSAFRRRPSSISTTFWTRRSPRPLDLRSTGCARRTSPGSGAPLPTKSSPPESWACGHRGSC
jgi:chromatin segregation and condensation protein Rec8/ScpA/Scc1 (kleisin family)